MPFPTDELTVTRVGDDRWMLVRTLRYVGERDTFTVPAGYVTDYATVPRVAIWLIPRYGRYTPAAILHDWLITDGLPAGLLSPNDVDGLFRRVMREQGVSTARRWVMWAGVRWGSLVAGRRSGWWRTAPAVLAVSVAVLPAVLPGGLAVVVSLALFWGGEMLTWLVDGRRGERPRLSLRT